MPVAYVSDQCGYCEQFVRALDASPLASAVRVVSVERVSRIPHYIVAVPTLVVEDETGISVYEADDAFDAVEGATARLAQQPPPHAPPRVGSPRVGSPTATATKAAEATEIKDIGPEDFDGQAHFAGLDAADEPDTFGCRANNFESLVSAEQDAALTARTLAAWERSLREETQSAQERSTDSADKRLESLMQQRQVAASAVASRVG
jgi:hypothetical protein